MDDAPEAEFTPAASAAAILPDPWDSQRWIPLNGGLERQKFSPLLMAIFALFIAFILFQLVIGPIATILLLGADGVGLSEFLEDPAGVLVEHARPMLIANTIGQVLGLALPILLILGLHSSRKGAFIRFRAPDGILMSLSILGLVGLVPLSWWLGSLNAEIPLPDWLQALEDSQNELIEQVFSQNLGVVFSLAMMALTPAFCEEILFRGYIQRQFERSLGVVWAIVLTGVIFGLYHLRISQAIPLSAIGIYLAYITWRTGSLWPAIVVHFLYNGFALSLGMYLNERTDIDLETLESMDMPIPVVLLAIAIVSGAVYWMHRMANRQLE